MLLRNICTLAISRHPFASFRTLQRFASFPHNGKPSETPPKDKDPFFIPTDTANSHEKIKLSDSAEQAVWASRVIREIINAKQPESINDPSLKERMMQLKIEDDKYFFDPEGNNRKIVLQPFHGGVQISSTIYEQYKMTQAAQAKGGKIIFCPNVLVTRQIFMHMNADMSDCLIHGGYGISKTMSMAFYSYFNQFNCKFWIEAVQDEEKRKQKEELIIRDLLPSSIQKYWYFTFSENVIQQFQKKPGYFQQYKDKFLRQSIIKQASNEIPAHQLERIRNLTSYQQVKDQIQRFYLRSDITRISMIDQINSLVSKMREYTILQQQKDEKLDDIQRMRSQIQKDIRLSNKEGKKKLKKLQIEQQKIIQKYKAIEEKDRNQQVIQNLLKIYQTLRSMGRIFKLGSSVNIEEKYLHPNPLQPKMPDWFKTLDVPYKHSKYPKKQIQFVTLIQQQWGKIDFFHYFWFQATRLNKVDPTKEENKAGLIEISKQPLKKHMRFLHVRQFFSTKEKCELNLELWKQFQEYSLDIMKQKIKKFQTTKGDTEMKRIFLSLLRKVADQCVEMGSNQFRCKVADLEFLIGSKILDYLQSDQHNKELIPFNLTRPSVIQDEKYLQILYDPQDFLDVTDTNSQDFYNYLLSYKFLNSFKMRPGRRAQALEHMLIEALLPQTQVFLPIHISSKTGILQYKQGNYEIKSMKIKDIAKYQHFNTGKLGAEKKFEKIFDKCMKNPDLFIMATPIMRQSAKQRQKILQNQSLEDYLHSSTSRSIDFIMLKYDSSKKRFQIYTIDVTISEDADYLQEKEDKAKQLQRRIYNQLVEGLRKKGKGDFVLEHIIIAPRMVCKASVANLGLSGTKVIGVLSYCSLDDIKIQQKTEALSGVCFERIQRADSIIRAQQRNFKK